MANDHGEGAALHQLLNAASEFQTADGRTLRMRALDDRAVAEFERWIVDAIIDDARHRAERAYPDEPDERRAVVREAVDFAGRVSITSNDPDVRRMVDHYMSSTEGTYRLVWLGLRAESPELTLDDVRDIMTAEDHERILDRFEQINDAAGAMLEARGKKKAASGRGRVSRTTATTDKRRRKRPRSASR